MDETQLVLVDLVHGSGLSPERGEALRLARPRVRVVALHDDGFGDDPILHGLSVDGFCPIADWSPIVAALADAPSR